MSEGEKLRVDVWLWRARFAKTRAAAAAMVAEGGVRLVRGASSRSVEKAGAGVGPGDVLVLPGRTGVRLVRIEALGTRRGPPAEARGLYSEPEEPKADIGGFA